MKTYRIVQLLAVGPGTEVLLTDAQAARRKHRLDMVGEGRYRTRDVLQFKAGEVVGLEGDLPKAHLERVELLDDHVRAPASKPAGASKKEKLAL